MPQRKCKLIHYSTSHDCVEVDLPIDYCVREIALFKHAHVYSMLQLCTHSFNIATHKCSWKFSFWAFYNAFSIKMPGISQERVGFGVTVYIWSSYRVFVWAHWLSNSHHGSSADFLWNQPSDEVPFETKVGLVCLHNVCMTDCLPLLLAHT